MSDLITVPDVAIEIGGRSDGQRIRGVRISDWEGLSIERSIDSGADGFSFSTPWNPTENVRRAFRPYDNTVVEVYSGDRRLITGYVERVSAQSDGSNRALNIQGRSVTGVLLDWSAGPPFEFSGLTFNQIAAQVAHPYSVRAVPDFGPLDDVQIEIGQSVYEFLSALASVNGRYGRPTPAGALEFVTIRNAAPVADLVEGQSPVLSISTSHDVTKLFNEYMVVATSDGEPGITVSEYDNRQAPGIRGRKIVQPSQQSDDYTQAAKLIRSRAMIDSYQPKARVTGWQHAGGYWTPGEEVRVLAPGAYIAQPSRLIIRKAVFTLDESGGLVTYLDLALPEAYSNTYPEVLPWAG
jgi:prophage tail gpP-like protein